MRAFKPVIHRRVVVNLVTERAIAGVLVKQTGPLLHLKDAELMEPDAGALPLDGEIVIERSQVDFIQAL